MSAQRIWKRFDNELFNQAIVLFRSHADRLEIHESLPLANFSTAFSANQTATQYRLILSRLGFILHLIDTPESFFETPNWRCLEMLSRITSTVLSPSLLNSDIEYLKKTIEKFLQLYSSLYTSNFPNKFHHLIHIPRSILLNGPPRYVSAMRFERKLGEIHPKINSRKNIISQLVNSFKYQMSIFLTKTDEYSKDQFQLSKRGTDLAVAKNNKLYDAILTQDVLSYLPNNCRIHLSIRELGCFFASGLVVTTSVPTSNWLSKAKPIDLWKIEVVFTYKDVLYIAVRKLICSNYCTEMLAYEVETSQLELNTIECYNLKSKTFSMHTIGGKSYVFIDSLPIKKF